MTSQYETNLWSTHINIVRLAEPITRCVRWRTQVFKIEGLVCKCFLPSPLPSFIFWLSFHFPRGQNRKSRSSVFFCSQTKRKCLLRRLRNTPHKRCQSPPPRRQFDENCHFFLQKVENLQGGASRVTQNLTLCLKNCVQIPPWGKAKD